MRHKADKINESATALSTVRATHELPLQKDLPEGWSWKTMGEISEVIGGGTPRTNVPEYYNSGNIAWITPADLSGYIDKYISHGSRFITETGLKNSSARLMPAGTVLYTSRAPIGYVAIAKNPVSTNQGFKSFLLKAGILPDYVYWYLKGSKNLAESYASGTTFMELSGTKAKQLPIPIAPIDQQKRIVAEIEKQFSRLDEAVAALKRIWANLKRYKASVLKAAVEGKLTEQWRKEHPDIEPASALLKHILVERKKKWEEKNPGKKYKEPATPATSNLPELPKGWVWVTLQQIFQSVTDGDHQPPPQTKSGVPFLVIGNVRTGKLDFTDTRYVSQEYFAQITEERIPRKGDILYTLVGSYGIALLVDTSREFCIQRHMAILKPTRSLNTRYFMHALDTSFVYRRATEIATGTAQKTVPLAGLREIAVPFPPLQEQQKIIEDVDSRLSVAEEIEAAVETNLKRADRLRQAILKKAFSGNLGRV
ncbi:MAG: specificity determinant for hsdM and hsdR [Nanoarchaeota archaeon]|nr:MAG: specificity determinant for hsdM and hsdR [Nanoarchaeota archaeon]